MKVQYQGRQVEGNPVDFLTRREDFNEYQLSDGNYNHKWKNYRRLENILNNPRCQVSFFDPGVPSET